MLTLKESLVQALDEKFITKSDYAEKKKSSGGFSKKRRETKDQEKELSKKFLDFFGHDNFRINHKGKEWYVHFTIHAMARYIERDAKLDKDWLNELLVKMIKVLQHKEKGQMFLVYSVSMKRAMVVNRKEDDMFSVVTVYPEAEQKASQGTKKVLIEQLVGTIYEGLIDDYVEIE